MSRRIISACVLAFFLASAFALADESKTMFPFVIEKGAPDNITNVQTWDSPAPVAGTAGFLVDSKGEFASASGKTRLLGTNFCFGASFTTKEKAERVADSLARFGVGVVRLHHMDSRDIWGKNFDKGTTEIDPDQLDRLDYVIYCLEQKGIYVNINLHVSRAFKEIDGFLNAGQLPTQNKGVDNFDRKMIEYQKKYAKDLLTHVNPYTGKSYADDPGVAVVEINNENSVVASWAWGQLDDLPEPYAGEFRALWNKWLLKKYGSTANLRKAWDCKSIPFGENKIAPISDNFNFKFDAGWRLESDANAKYSYKVLPASETGIGSPALQFSVEQIGDVAWHPQFNFSGLKIKKGSPYLLEFKLRVKAGEAPNVGHSLAHEPWGAVGFSMRPKTSDEWTTVKAAFIAPEDDDMTRISFSGFSAGDVFEIADVSFREGGDLGFAEDQHIEDGTIPVAKKKGEPTLFGEKGLADFSDFLHDLENDYWQEMYSYVKSLGVKSLVAGTQLQYGFWHNQARLDYCDIHAYWNHPNFPRRSWDSNDWLVKNTCLANSPDTGTLSNLSALRVIGRPFTCSEYDHPYPNQYCAEGNVMLAAVAAFQDWSATFQFAWSHGDDFDRDACGSFFDECSQTVKIAHLPACYGMFVRGDVQSGPGEFVYAPSMTEQEEMSIMPGLLSDYHRPLVKGLGIDQSLSLALFSGVALPDLDLPKSTALKKAKKIESWSDLPARFGSAEKKEIVNDFGEITWNYKEKNKSFFTVDTSNTKVFSGFVGSPRQFDGLTLDIGETELGWATVSIVKAKNAVKGAKKTGKLTSGSYLLTATGLMHNTDAKTVKVDEDNISNAGHFGGSNGRAPILCEGIPATVTLDGVSAKNVEVYALNNRGDRAEKLAVKPNGDGCAFSFGPEQKTIWYEIVVK